MTVPVLSGGGFGGYKPGSAEARGLSQIDSSKYSYANTDFVRNMQRLNQATDYMAAMMGTMQKGIDEANKNIIEEIQGFAGDLFVLFAGLEPTGIDVGDLKYVLQGIGALLGIGPDTPFPLNLFEAANHLLGNFLIPLPQFTDIIFDSIIAWAEALGLSESFVEAVVNFKEAVEDLFGGLDAFVNLFRGLLDALGIGDLGSLEWFANLFAKIVNVAIAILEHPLVGNVIVWISDFLVPFINLASNILNALNPSSWISAGQIVQEGSEIVPPVTASTINWNVSGDNDNGWTFDPDESQDGTVGSFTTLANGQNKVLRNTQIFTCANGNKFNVKGYVKWEGVPTNSNHFGIALEYYLGNTLQHTHKIPIATPHLANSSGWVLLSEQVTVPNLPDIDGFRITAYTDIGFNTGQVWVDKLSVKKVGLLNVSIIDGLIDFIANLPLNAAKLFGQIPSALLGLIPIGHISNNSPNLLTEAGFSSPDAIAPGGTGWVHDPSEGRTSPGSAKATASSRQLELASDYIEVNKDQEFTCSAWVKWVGAAYTGSNHLTIGAKVYDADDNFLYNSTLGTKTITSANQVTWTQIEGNASIPEGVGKIRMFLRVNANVNAGDFWWDDASLKKTGLLKLGWVQGLPQELQNIFGFIEDVIDAIGNVFRIIPIFGSTIADLIDALTDFLLGTEDTAALAADAKLGLDATREAIVTGISTSAPPDEITDEIVEDTIATQTSVIIQQGAAIEALQQQFLTETNQGRSIMDDFEYVEATDIENTGNWTRYVLEGTDPKVNTEDGHNAGIDSNGTVIYVNDVETLTSTQRVTVVTAGAMSYAFFDGRRPHIGVVTRASADGQKWVRAYWNNAQQVIIDYKNGASSGVLWNSGADNTPLPGAGQALTIESGFGGVPGQYRILRGGTPINIINDVSNLTDWTQKGWGIALRRDANWGPPKITQATANDNAPPTIPGVALRVTRASGSVTMPQTGGNLAKFSNNAFNSTVYITDKIEFDPANNCKIKFLKTGRYAITLRIQGPALSGTVTRFILGLMKGNEPVELGNEIGPNNSDTGILQRYRETFIVYAVAGDEFYPAYLTSSSNSITVNGDALGLNNYMIVMEI